MRRAGILVGCAVACVGLVCCGVPTLDSPTLLTPSSVPAEPVPTTTQQPDSPSIRSSPVATSSRPRQPEPSGSRQVRRSHQAAE